MEKAIEKIVNELGIEKSLARKMLATFKNDGGLACLMEWPEQFSIFSREKNVLDILLAEDLV